MQQDFNPQLTENKRTLTSNSTANRVKQFAS